MRIPNNISKLRPAVRTYAGNFAEQSTEAACACAIMMVQGQILLLSVTHWAIALQTGLTSGAIATALIVVARMTKPWMIAVVLGLITAIVDFFVHPGDFGPVFAEAVLTGIGAGILSLLVTAAIRFVIRRRQRAGA